MLKTFAALSAAMLAPALIAPTPAVAYDPCQRATQELQEAEDAVNRWLDRHCRPGGSMQCTGNAARFNQLFNRYQDAKANRARQCG